MIDRIAMGKRIKMLREIKGLTQMQLAQMIGKSEKFVEYAERGFGLGDSENGELENILDVVIALDTSVDYLAQGTDGVQSLRDRIRNRKAN